MAPATPKLCQVPGCEDGELDEMDQPTPYSTPADLPTRKDVEDDMKNHIYQAHTLPMEIEKLAVSKLEMEAKKLEAEAAKILAEKAPSAGGSLEVPSESAQSRGEPRGEKKASIPRPDVEEGITESDWSFFLVRWKMYQEATRCEGKSAIQQLWAACSL